MKILFDLFPVILFFVTYKFVDIFYATAVAMAATVAQIAWVYFRRGKVEPMLWVSLALILVFGGATLWLHDETFIKWKPTILYGLFAGVLLLAPVLFKKNLIKAMLSPQVSIPEPVWRQLNWAWAGFFAFMGALNLWVAYSFTTDVWVDFKLFGGMGLMLGFVLLQGLVLARHVRDEPGAD